MSRFVCEACPPGGRKFDNVMTSPEENLQQKLQPNQTTSFFVGQTRGKFTTA
jgi:hypothetical protein